MKNQRISQLNVRRKSSHRRNPGQTERKNQHYQCNQKSRDRPRNSNVEKHGPRTQWRLNANERTQRSDQRGKGNEKRQSRGNPVERNKDNAPSRAPAKSASGSVRREDP